MQCTCKHDDAIVCAKSDDTWIAIGPCPCPCHTLMLWACDCDYCRRMDMRPFGYALYQWLRALGHPVSLDPLWELRFG